MLKDFSLPALSAGLLVAFVGFASTFAVVVQGLRGVGASPAEAASGLMALSVAMGLCGAALSLWRRMPISVAWSTPGVALLATAGAPQGGFAAAVGAFLVCGVLVVIAGMWRPLGRWVSRIPAPLANAMLAGVLLGLCLAPVRAVAELPLVGLAVAVAWAVVAAWRRLLAMPAAVVVAVLGIVLTTDMAALPAEALWPTPVLVVPVFDLAAIVGIGVPLFIVTMASQNIPGMAVLHANDYRPDPGPLFQVTGWFSLAAAPFGGHVVNLAALTAALCAGPDAHPDPARRYWAAVIGGIGYVLFGLLAGVATAFISASPPVLIEAVAGLALLGPFGAAMVNALKAEEHREAAVVCFVVTASGLAFVGIAGAFWGLLAGGAMMGLARLRRAA